MFWSTWSLGIRIRPIGDVTPGFTLTASIGAPASGSSCDVTFSPAHNSSSIFVTNGTSAGCPEVAGTDG